MKSTGFSSSKKMGLDGGIKEQKLNHDMQISDLPECILLHILSFLPTKFAVRTSILSTKWRYLWTFLPTLDFDDGKCYFSITNTKRALIQKMKFVDSVNKVLLLHELSRLQKFSLSCRGCDISHINTWVNVAIKKNVEELCLDIKDQCSIRLPHCLFTCKSLVSLKLKSIASIISVLPASICFTKLKTLHLESICFSMNGLFRKLLSNCPVLESLILDGCRWSDTEVDISSPTIRTLSLCDCVSNDYKIKISIPVLTSFEYVDYYIQNYFTEKLSSLNDASIDTKMRGKCSSMRFKKSYRSVCKLLRGVSVARSLTLSDLTIERLSNAPDLLKLLPTFHNLNKLVVTSARNKKHFLVIACLLKSSPVLESLVINIEQSPKYDSCKEENQESKKLCLEYCHDHIKVVKMNGFGGTEDELEFMNLLSGNAKNMKRLEKVILAKASDFDNGCEVMKKLVSLKRTIGRKILSWS